MIIVVCFTYVLATVLYLIYGDSSYLWGGINIITQIAFIGYLCYLLGTIEGFRKIEKRFFNYLTWLSVANCIYILFCIIKGTGFAIYNTDIFAYIMSIGFVTFMMHSALDKS